jgi:hypothetical protein
VHGFWISKAEEEAANKETVNKKAKKRVAFIVDVYDY